MIHRKSFLSAEVRISMRVMDRDKKYFTDGEKTLLEKLTDNKSDAVMSLRSEFDKVCFLIVRLGKTTYIRSYIISGQYEVGEMR